MDARRRGAAMRGWAGAGAAAVLGLALTAVGTPEEADAASEQGISAQTDLVGIGDQFLASTGSPEVVSHQDVPGSRWWA